MFKEGKYDSKEFLTYLIRGMAEGVIFIDHDNIVRLCNPVGGEIRGVKGDEIVGDPLMKCHPKSTEKRVLKVIEDLRSGESKELKRTVKLKDGFYEHTYSTVSDSAGKFLGVVAVSRDITERVLLEKSLKDHSEDLERSNHMKDLFTDIMRHDFINQASIIKNYSELLAEEELSETAAEDLKRIKRNAERLIEMIENASKLSKLEDASRLKYEETDLTSMIEKAVEEFEPMLDEKNISVNLKMEGEHKAEVSSFIEDVFLNLLSNAIKYNPRDSEITLDIQNQDSSLLISVADEASKIPPEHKNTIFERFQRLEKKGVKGSGLGLAIVKRIIDLHNGSVWVDDNSAGGNVFYVKIPKQRS